VVLARAGMPAPRTVSSWPAPWTRRWSLPLSWRSASSHGATALRSRTSEW